MKPFILFLSISTFTANVYAQEWKELGSTSPLNANQLIQSVTKDVKGNVYAAGQFGNSSGKKYVAKWTGLLGPN